MEEGCNNLCPKASGDPIVGEKTGGAVLATPVLAALIGTGGDGVSEELENVSALLYMCHI